MNWYMGDSHDRQSDYTDDKQRGESLVEKVGCRESEVGPAVAWIELQHVAHSGQPRE